MKEKKKKHTHARTFVDALTRRGTLFATTISIPWDRSREIGDSVVAKEIKSLSLSQTCVVAKFARVHGGDQDLTHHSACPSVHRTHCFVTRSVSFMNLNNTRDTSVCHINNIFTLCSSERPVVRVGWDGGRQTHTKCLCAIILRRYSCHDHVFRVAEVPGYIVVTAKV